MIWESSYWKDDLLALSEKINIKYRTTSFTEELSVEFEKDIMISLYSIRKLIEAYKLSSNTKSIQLEVKSYRNLKSVTLLNWHRIEELFDLDNPINEKLQVNQFYNQIIHSYIFLIATDKEKGIDGFFFCSDRMRNKKLYYIELTLLDKFFAIVGNDYPAKQIFEYDESIQDYMVYSSTPKNT
ncbi:hypothetical protein [Paenibacillus sp. tmac-D7]|uniref:hypothetical protein n=1 Tax=Paenibacillus sp. tmac-D7 TaxID=2591462 RepID=UPI001143E07E|nr:hypothetical protein [Paenibacillus sp. tmac-D7]